MSQGVVMKLMRNNEMKEKSLIDPVGKFRVCEPQTLIDTDYEYGLQSTKWETLELVNNIPTFYSRDNDESLTVTDITTTINSYNVYVYTSTPHNMIVGTPILVTGVGSFSAEGSYVVNAILSTTSFVYKAKSLQTSTGSIYEAISTNVYVGKAYQGTQYSLDSLGYIKTNGTNEIIVDTLYPHGFTQDTSFILSKSVGQKQLVIANSNVDTLDSFSLSNTIFTSSNNGLGNSQPYQQNGVIVHDWEGKLTAYVDNTDVNASTNTITCSNHGFLDNDNVMYIPALLTLSNIDVSFAEQNALRMPSISTFNVTNPYTYTYDGTATSISTGGSNMFAAGTNNVHSFGALTNPTFAIPYSTSNWTPWDSFTDYRTFGQSSPYCTVIRHTNNQTWYYKIDVANTGAQAGTIHERNGANNTNRNFMYARWSYFGMYNNGTRPSFYYLICSLQTQGSQYYPVTNIHTGTATTTISSASYTYSLRSEGTYYPAYTIVMLLSRANGAQITQSELLTFVNRICDSFETFTGLMGEYRLFNQHLYNYDNAGDYYINNGGNDMFDNNKLGNLLYIDNQLLSYRERTMTSVNTQFVQYKFISDCQPQIMFSRIMESRSVVYRISDTWAVGSGTTAGGYPIDINTNGWLCRWGYHSLHSRSSRASVHRIFMAFCSTEYGYPAMGMNTWGLSNTSTNIQFTITHNGGYMWPGYVAVVLLSQPNGVAVSQTYFDYIVRDILGNCSLPSATSWPLALAKNIWSPNEYSKYNLIGNMTANEVYQVNVLNSHQFQLMDIPRGILYNNAANFSGFVGSTGYSNGNTTVTFWDRDIDITTNFINWRSLYENRSYVRFIGNGNGYQLLNIQLIDESSTIRYSHSVWLGGGNVYTTHFYLQNLQSWGSVNDPVRRYTKLRFLGITNGSYYTNDYFQAYMNDIIPAYQMAPISSPIKTINQGSTRECITKHAFSKVYRIHSFSGVGNGNAGGYYMNFLRSASDPLSIVANDDMYLFQHPDITGIEWYTRTGTNSRILSFPYGFNGPSIPYPYRQSFDNINASSYVKYNISSSFGINPTYSYARVMLSGSTQSSGDTVWWPGVAWFVLARDIQTKNTICIPNHGIPTNTAIQLENFEGKGIKELEEGVYYASPYNTNMIRLKTSTGTSTTIDFSYIHGKVKLYYTIINPNQDSVYVEDHGLFEGTPIVYRANTNVLYPLVNATTYYAFGVTRDRFGLSLNKTTRLNLGGTELFEDLSYSSSIGTGNIIQSISNTTLTTPGTGTGTNGGFATLNNQKYLLMNGVGTREIISKSLNLTTAVNLSIYVIRGTSTNGGEVPDAGEELYAAYSLNGSTWVDIGIITSVTASPSWSLQTITIPVVARVSPSYLKVYQKVNSGVNFDNYGIQYIKIDAGVTLEPSDIHYLSVGGVGAVDGTYVTSSVSQNSSILTLKAPFNVPAKTIYVNPFKVINLKDNTLYLPLHSMKSGATVKYQSNGNTDINPLQDNTDYFVTRIDENHVRIATTYASTCPIYRVS